MINKHTWRIIDLSWHTKACKAQSLKFVYLTSKTLILTANIDSLFKAKRKFQGLSLFTYNPCLLCTYCWIKNIAKIILYRTDFMLHPTYFMLFYYIVAMIYRFLISFLLCCCYTSSNNVIAMSVTNNIIISQRESGVWRLSSINQSILLLHWWVSMKLKQERLLSMEFILCCHLVCRRTITTIWVKKHHESLCASIGLVLQSAKFKFTRVFLCLSVIVQGHDSSYLPLHINISAVCKWRMIGSMSLPSWPSSYQFLQQ